MRATEGRWNGLRRFPALLEDLAREARLAARSLGRSPGFSGVAVLTLAVGIGAGTAMFGVLKGILLNQLPVRNQEELIVLWGEAPSGAWDHVPLGQGELTAFRERSRSLEVAGVAYQGAGEYALREGGTPLILAGVPVAGNFFPVLGVRPVVGRTLLPPDDVPGAEPVMVIGHGFWQRHFGGDPGAVGSTLEWNGRPFTVVGVLPRGFEFPHSAEFWVPMLAAYPEEASKEASGWVLYDIVGRLRPGFTKEMAAAELETYFREGEAQRSPTLRGLRAVATPLAERITGEVRPTLWAAMAAVGLLLLIACVNVANLLLIRASARERELAVRAALGAGRGRLIRQLLAESAALALLGGLLGTALAFAAVRVLRATAPPELPRREMIEVDGGVLLVALGVTAAAALLSGLLPALLSPSGDPGRRLRGGGRAASDGRGARALRHSLVVGQVSLAILVVAGAGLLLRSLVLLQGAEMGFNPDRLLVFRTSLPPAAFPERPQQLEAQREMLTLVSSLPGVSAATALPSHPFSGEGGWSAMYSGEGQSAEVQAANPLVNLESVGPEYFRTLELPIRRGRAFTERDRKDAPPVAIVSEAVARRTWPGEDPLGKRVKLGPPEGPGPWHSVVGVVGDTRYRELAEPQPTVYFPTLQFPGPVPMTLAVRTRSDPETLVPRLREALLTVHPDWMLSGGGSMRQLLAEPLARPRFSTALLGTFALVTLLLAATGIYGALAATVRQRTREIGIRMAVGATVQQVRGLVLRQGLRLALWGCAIGIAAALLATQALRGMLFGVGPHDPLTFAGVAAVVLATAALACYLPARRATRVDPVEALRAE